MFMVFCVLDDPDHLDQVLEAWQENGIGGVTIAETTGLRRKRRQYVPMRYVFGTQEPVKGNMTLLAIVDDEAAVQRCLDEVEKVVGDLNEPNTGVFTSWPLFLTKGAGGRASNSGAKR